MISAKDAENISRLLKQLSRGASTEDTIAFVADIDGMLSSCKKVVTLCREGNEEARGWIQKEGGKYGIQIGSFLQEAGQILQLFLSDDEQDDSYEILGLSSSANLAEVKQAYRKLTVQYHPDTAGNAGRDTTEQFIRINKAYHSITTNKGEDAVDETTAGMVHTWRYGKTERDSSTRGISKKTILWICVLLLGAVLSCRLSAQIYSRKVMVSTLQHSGAAFVPPAKKSPVASPAVAMTFAEKMKIAEAKEKTEQPAQQKEAEAEVVNRTKSIEYPELESSAQGAISTEQDKAVSLPPQELVQAKHSLPDVDSEKTKSAEKVKITKEQHSAEIKAEQTTGSKRNEGGDTTRKSTVQTTQNGIVSDSKKMKFPEELRQPVAERIAQQEHHRSTLPTNEVAKQKIEAPPVVEPPPVQEVKKKDSRAEPYVQQRIDTFLSGYCRAYSEKNLMEFSRFFELDAIENGKPIAELMSTYTKVFDSAQTLGLQISTLKWEESAKGQITLTGRFKIDLVYKNDEVVHGRGMIDFLLVTEHGKLLVKKMSYSFDQ